MLFVLIYSGASVNKYEGSCEPVTGCKGYSKAVELVATILKCNCVFEAFLFPGWSFHKHPDYFLIDVHNSSLV